MSDTREVNFEPHDLGLLRQVLGVVHAHYETLGGLDIECSREDVARLGEKLAGAGTAADAMTVRLTAREMFNLVTIILHADNAYDELPLARITSSDALHELWWRLGELDGRVFPGRAAPGHRP
jgi:hypothetical protein